MFGELVGFTLCHFAGYCEGTEGVCWWVVVGGCGEWAGSD